MHRLFISLDLPDPVRAQLEEISFGLSGANWVDPDQMHLTLRFIGEVDGASFQGVQEALRAVRAPAFTFSLHGVGHFPPRGAPQVLWAGVEKSDPLLHLRHRVERSLQKAGLKPDDRKFFPHVTVARLRSTPAEQVGRFLSYHALFKSSAIEARDFRLYSSTLTSEGAVHTLENSYPLDGSGD